MNRNIDTIFFDVGATLRYVVEDAEFSAAADRELMELEGDTGGKKVIRQHFDDTFVYELKDEKQLEDVDVPLMEKGCYERNGQ